MLEKLKKERHDSLLKGLNTTTCKACMSDPNTIICSACRDICYHKASTCRPTTPKLTHEYSCIHYVPAVTHLHPCTHPHVSRINIHSSDIVYSKLPELVSVYDRPFLTPAQKEDLVKSSYNKESITQEVKLIQNLKIDNEKLRFQNKIDKTNDIVDSIITKASALQADLKKKSAEIKIKEDLLKLEHDYNHLKHQSCLKSILKHRSKSSCHRREHSVSPCYELERSSSRHSRCRERSSSSRHHHKRSSSRHSESERSSSRHSVRERSLSAKRSKSPIHHHHYYDYKHQSLTSTSDSDDIKRNRYWKSWKDVPARVESWNHERKDSKIY